MIKFKKKNSRKELIKSKKTFKVNLKNLMWKYKNYKNK